MKWRFGLLLVSTMLSTSAHPQELNGFLNALGALSNAPSIDCTVVTNTVATILCNVPEAAKADWDLNATEWALGYMLDDKRRKVFEQEQQNWRHSLDQRCGLPPFETQQEQAFRNMAGQVTRQILGGRGLPIPQMPGPQPLTQAHVNCLINIYNSRVEALRTRLSGDALAESKLSVEQHIAIQMALEAKGFLRSDQVGPGTHDGEFGPITRKAIRQFQQGLGEAPTGFFSYEQVKTLVETPEDEARAAAAAKAEQDRLSKIAQDRLNDIRQREAQREENERQETLQKQAAAKAEQDRIDAEAEAAKAWRLRVERAHVMGDQFASKSEIKWELSASDNPMTDDKDYTVTSRQTNGTGAIAVVEGSCPKPGKVTFLATLRDATTGLSPGLPDSGPGSIAGYKRINDDPAMAWRFQKSQSYNNVILLSTLVSLDSLESIEATWLIRTQLETAKGRLDIQVPMFNANIQKLLVACGKQLESAQRRGSLPDAPPQ
jgi:peptidoglycan hydrolase-like protein with peptidoglycan-binding domain